MYLIQSTVLEQLYGQLVQWINLKYVKKTFSGIERYKIKAKFPLRLPFYIYAIPSLFYKINSCVALNFYNYVSHDI